MVKNRVQETQNLLSLQLFSFLVGLRTYQHPCISFHNGKFTFPFSFNPLQQYGWIVKKNTVFPSLMTASHAISLPRCVWFT